MLGFINWHFGHEISSIDFFLEQDIHFLPIGNIALILGTILSYIFFFYPGKVLIEFLVIIFPGARSEGNTKRGNDICLSLIHI